MRPSSIVDTDWHKPQHTAIISASLKPFISSPRPFSFKFADTIIRYLVTLYGAASLYPVKARARVDQWIDWQASDLNRSWSYAFLYLVRHSPSHQDPHAFAAGRADWSRHMQILERQLASTGTYVAGDTFSLADIPIGLSVNRWFETPLDHPTCRQ